MEIESRVTNTGPVSSTISPMTVDLVGPGGAFGKLDLPVIKTNSAGTDVNIPAQLIKITDKAAFKAFVTAILRDESLLLQLKNGKGTVKAMMGMSAQIDYNKDCPLKGMHGPKTTISKTEVAGGGFKSFEEVDQIEIVQTSELLDTEKKKTSFTVYLYRFRVDSGV